MMNKLLLLAPLLLGACMGPGTQQANFARESGTGTCLGVAVAAGAGGGVSVFPQGMIGNIEETATTCKITATDWKYAPPGAASLVIGPATPVTVAPAKSP